jgi:hypothetical protein
MKFTQGIFNVDLELKDLTETGNAGEYNTRNQRSFLVALFL